MSVGSTSTARGRRGARLIQLLNREFQTSVVVTHGTLTKVAALTAIGLYKPLEVGRVLAEGVAVAGVGGVVQTLGGRALFGSGDISR